jgi:uncharacterized protein (DUF924 family)
MAEGLHDLFMFWYGFDKIRNDIQNYKHTESSIRKQWDEVWFAKTKDIDNTIETKYSHLVNTMMDYEPQNVIEKVAKMILYDQIPRNIFRGSAQAYQYDHIAKAVAYDLLENHEQTTPLFVMISIVLTLIHSECLDDHLKVSELLISNKFPSIEHSGVMTTLREIAKRHKERVYVFGRLPERAKIKHCRLTQDEQTFLAGLH